MTTEFPETPYSLIAQIRKGSHDSRRDAFGLFVSGYQRALVRFLANGKGVPEHDAEDLVQDFLLNKVMNGNVLNIVKQRGKFRNLLRKSIQNYLVDALRKNNRQPKQHSNLSMIAIESLEQEFDSFDHAWALGIFTVVLKQMQARCPYWGIFLDRALTVPPVPYDQVVERYRFADPVVASNSLMTAKRTFNRLVIETLVDRGNGTSTDDFREEIVLLKRVLADSKAISNVVDSLVEIEFSSVNFTPLVFEDSVPKSDRMIADEPWSAPEVEAILDNMLTQPASRFIGDSAGSRTTIETLLLSPGATQRLEQLKLLKDYFKPRNANNESLKGFPQEVVVTIVFCCIASFIKHGGERSEITSLSSDQLLQRFELLASRQWLPDGIRTLVLHSVSRS